VISVLLYVIATFLLSYMMLNSNFPDEPGLTGLVGS